MENLLLLLLGIIQGITEPLPISSSGHLVIFQEIFNIGTTDLNFEIIANAGSLVAIIIFYRKTLQELIINDLNFVFKKDKSCGDSFRYTLLIVIATIPAGLFGLLLKDKIEEYKTLVIVGFSLIITSIALFIINAKSVSNDRENVTFRDSIVMGLFQIIALFPGISRSGSTTVGGLGSGLNIESTLKFSFMMYIPISIATTTLGVVDIVRADSVNYVGYTLGFIGSLIATYFAIGLLINTVKKGKLKYFAYYCFVVGLGVVIIGQI